MKERDYINVRELSSIMCAKKCLNDITPENSVVIDPMEYRFVMQQLHDWEDRLFKTCTSDEQ